MTKDLGMLGRHGAVLSASFRLVCSGACLTALVITPSPDAIAAQAATGRIVVSKNALVSGDRPKNEHGETVICASLSDPNLLIAGGMTTTNGGQLQAFGETTYQLVYSSRDGGKTWHHAFETLDRGFSPDAACAYGPDGSAHFSTMNGPIGEGQDYSNNPLKILDYRSPDGGKTWEPPVMLTGVSGADRQYMIFDNTGGRYHGRYYIAFNAAFNQRTVKDKPATGRQMYALSRSPDGGKTWDLPALRPADTRFHNGNMAMLSDGSIVSILGMGFAPPTPCTANPCHNRDMEVVISPPGGEFVGIASHVADAYGLTNFATHMISAVAVDASSAYKDRIYVTWNDDRWGRLQPLLSYSTDRGRSWSTPRSLSDSKPFVASDSTKGPHDTAPWIAVNKDGVVGAMWLDRRNYAENTGYDVRFSASLDGGDTWLPSVKVSEAPMRPRLVWENAPYQFTFRANQDTISRRLGNPWWDFSGGDATFMTADAAGNFHPVWVDARTGVRQIWTTSVTVNGTVVPQRVIAAPTLVTRSISLDLVPGTEAYDSITHTIRIDAKLRNTGKTAIKAPLVAQVTALETKAARSVRVVGSDNGQSTIGATWDFTGLVTGGALNAGESTGAKHLVFQLDDIRPPTYANTIGGYFSAGYLGFSIVVRSAAP